MACARREGGTPRRPRSGPRRSAGVTLVELMVVLVVLGVMAGLAGLAWRPDAWTRPAAEDGGVAFAVRSARARAVSSGTAVTVQVSVEGRVMQVRAMPDGRVIGAEAFGLDPLSGDFVWHLNTLASAAVDRNR